MDDFSVPHINSDSEIQINLTGLPENKTRQRLASSITGLLNKPSHYLRINIDEIYEDQNLYQKSIEKIYPKSFSLKKQKNNFSLLIKVQNTNLSHVYYFIDQTNKTKFILLQRRMKWLNDNSPQQWAFIQMKNFYPVIQQNFRNNKNKIQRIVMEPQHKKVQYNKYLLYYDASKTFRSRQLVYILERISTKFIGQKYDQTKKAALRQLRQVLNGDKKKILQLEEQTLYPTSILYIVLEVRTKISQKLENQLTLNGQFRFRKLNLKFKVKKGNHSIFSQLVKTLQDKFSTSRKVFQEGQGLYNYLNFESYEQAIFSFVFLREKNIRIEMITNQDYEKVKANI